MSYDINIWASHPPRQLDVLLTDLGFVQQTERSFCLAAKTWHIVLHVVDHIHAEDIPDAAMALLPGIKTLFEMTLEPVSAPKSTYAKARQCAKNLAIQTKGVIEDKQEGVFKTPAGIKRYSAPKRAKEDCFSLIELSWWLDHDRMLSESGLKPLLSAIARFLPEALPRRYGLYEPPQHTYSETGPAHFLDFLKTHHAHSVVCYPSRPVWDIYFEFRAPPGFKKRGDLERYICPYFSISIDAAVLGQTGWPRHLVRFWRALSGVLMPFYGDVRILDGFIWGRATCFSDAQTQIHPIRNGWWTGVPKTLGQAVVFGKRYADVWLDIQTKAHEQNGLFYAATENWQARQDVTHITGDVPEIIAQVYPNDPLGCASPRYGTALPGVFPFA